VKTLSIVIQRRFENRLTIFNKHKGLVFTYAQLSTKGLIFFSPGVLISHDHSVFKENRLGCPEIESDAKSFDSVRLDWLHGMIKLCLKNLVLGDVNQKAFFVVMRSILLMQQKLSADNIEGLKYASFAALLGTFGFFDFVELRESGAFFHRLCDDAGKIGSFFSFEDNLKKIEKNISKIKKLVVDLV
jgi:hypothetical protein